MNKLKDIIKMYMKNLIKGKGLYKKEQRVILVMTLCFIMSGICLPAISNYGMQNGTDPGQIHSETRQDKSKKESTQESSPEMADENAKESTQQSSPGQSNQSDRSGKDAVNPPGNSGSSGKTWVPPVYKTIHHEAVYETRRVVICNYCGATFGSTGEFQVHKDAHGG